MLLQPSDLERDIIQGLQDVARRARCREIGWGNTEWTSEIKQALVRLAHERGHLACTSSCEDADASEWLFDVAFYENHPPFDAKPKQRMKRLILAAESEWSPN